MGVVSLVYFIHLIFKALFILIIIQVILSWIPEARYRFREGSRLLDKIVNPMLDPFRRLVPPSRTGGLDLSPILAIFALRLIERLVMRILVMR
jgi:YggT family protein